MSWWLLLAAALAVARRRRGRAAVPPRACARPRTRCTSSIAAERRLLEAEEERDRALAALQELEADHRAGRISDDDYRAVVGSLRRDAAEALRTLDRLGRPTGRDFRRGGEDRLMGRRAGLVAAAAVALASLLAAGAAVGDPGTDKARVDTRLGGLRGQAAAQQRQAGVLTSQLSAVAEQVRDLQAGVDAQRARLAVLEGTLASARTRLASLERTIAAQTARLTRLRGQYDIALRRLERRVRDLYMTDGPDTLSFVLGTASFADLIDNLDLLGRIGRQDEEIAARVKLARDGLADARRRTTVARAEAVRVEAAGRVGDRRAARARLATRREP